MFPALYGVQQSAWHGACIFPSKREFLQFLLSFDFPVLTSASVNKQYFLGVLGPAFGAQGGRYSTCCQANWITFQLTSQLVCVLMSPSDHQGLITLLSSLLDHLSAHHLACTLLTGMPTSALLHA